MGSAHAWGFAMDLVQQQVNLEILGQRLKTIRELRQMSPLKLAAEMESSLTSIRDWENGARKLQSDTIRRLAVALDLSYPEEVYWLGLAGHLPKMTMPSKHQIIEALEVYYAELVDLPFPAQISDHHFTYWAVNPATIDFLGSREPLANLMKQKLTGLDVIFNSQIGFLQRATESQDTTQRQTQLTRRIVGRSLHRRHEPFYQDFPNLMRQRLLPEDYEQFITIWEEANSAEQEQKPQLEDVILMQDFEFQYPDSRVRRLQMRGGNRWHFGDIFEITLFYPSEPEGDNLFTPIAEEGVKLWEITDVGNLLQSYR